MLFLEAVMKLFFNMFNGFKHPILTVMLLTAVATGQWSTQSPIPTYLDIRGIAAPTAQHVFIATDDNPFDSTGALYESADSGTTWISLDIPINLNDPFHGIFFIDNQNGWVYGNDNYRTVDGGISWTQLPFLGTTYFMEFYTLNTEPLTVEVISLWCTQATQRR
jgi:hypothetical protein